MPSHHPNNNLLTEFAAGTLPLAQSVAVKAHFHFCPQCQQTVKHMEEVGGAMLAALTPQPFPADSFDQLMNKIDQRVDVKTVNQSQAAVNTVEPEIPKILSKLLSNQSLTWKKVNRSLQSAPLIVGQNKYEVSLQRIKAGDSVPEHDHRGTEITVVLEGSFSDAEGIYQAGDFLVKEPGDIHQPISARHQDCLCLTVQEAPVKLTGFWGKLLNPFIKLKAA